jgi:hypothetical protein
MDPITRYILEQESRSKMEIQPRSGVGIYKLGDKYNQIRNCKPFRKTPTSKNLECQNGNVHLFFNSKSEVNQIELFSGSNVTFDGYNFFKRSYKDAVMFLKKKDPSIKVSKDQAISKMLGIRVWTDGDQSLDSVLISKE